MNKLLGTLVVAATALAAQQAMAVTVVSIDKSPAAEETVFWTPVGQFSATPHEYLVTTDTASTFFAYCVELRQALTPLPNQYAAQPFTEPLATKLGKLFQVANFRSDPATPDGIDTNLERSALQLAIWNAQLDSDATLDSGDFQLVTDNNGARALANTWLAAADALAQTSFTATRLYSREEQDLVTSIPEPSTYALMAAGLLGLGFVARRRSRRD